MNSHFRLPAVDTSFQTFSGFGEMPQDAPPQTNQNQKNIFPSNLKSTSQTVFNHAVTSSSQIHQTPLNAFSTNRQFDHFKNDKQHHPLNNTNVAGNRKREKESSESNPQGSTKYVFDEKSLSIKIPRKILDEYLPKTENQSVIFVDSSSLSINPLENEEISLLLGLTEKPRAPSTHSYKSPQISQMLPPVKPLRIISSPVVNPTSAPLLFSATQIVPIQNVTEKEQNTPSKKNTKEKRERDNDYLEKDSPPTKRRKENDFPNSTESKNLNRISKIMEIELLEKKSMNDYLFLMNEKLSVETALNLLEERRKFENNIQDKILKLINENSRKTDKDKQEEKQSQH